jgi:hypothetical protein
MEESRAVFETSQLHPESGQGAFSHFFVFQKNTRISVAKIRLHALVQSPI